MYRVSQNCEQYTQKAEKATNFGLGSSKELMSRVMNSFIFFFVPTDLIGMPWASLSREDVPLL
jgi:hypothetical protein